MRRACSCIGLLVTYVLRLRASKVLIDAIDPECREREMQVVSVASGFMSAISLNIFALSHCPFPLVRSTSDRSSGASFALKVMKYFKLR